MADQEQERAEVHEASGSAKDRRGPKRGKQNNRLPNKGASRITTAAADILNKVKSAGVAQRQLCQYLPITSRGFGFVSTKVWEYLEDQRRQVIQQIDYFSPTRLWRLSLALAYVKAFNGSKHAHIGVENPDGFYPGDMRQPPTEVVLSLARIERFPLPLVAMINAIGHVKCGDIDWSSLFVCQKSKEGEVVCDPFTLNWFWLREQLLSYDALTQAAKTLFRQHCPIPGIVYGPQHAIDNIDFLAPEDFVDDIEDLVVSYLRLARIIDSKIPGFLVLLNLQSGEGTSSILGNSFDIGTVALPTYPRSITLKTIEKMSDAECTLAVMSLIGEIPVNGIISSGYDYRKRAIGKSTVELRWTTGWEAPGGAGCRITGRNLRRELPSTELCLELSTG